MCSSRRTEQGFTLVEIVCTLMVIGVLGVLLFSGFGSALRGYGIMREAGTSAIQTELALLRLQKECSLMASIPDISETSLSFTRTDGQTVTISGKTGGPLTLAVGAPTGTVSGLLLSTISGFSVTRFPEEKTSLPEYVTFTFSVPTEAGDIAYSLTVSPRNAQTN